MNPRPRRLATAVLLAAVLTAAAGCGSSTSTSTTTQPTSGSTTTTPTPGSTSSTPSSGPANSTAPAVVLPLATATSNGTFLSPTKNLACLIAQNPSNQVRCASFSPALLVTMTTDGTLTTCQGTSCELGNPALDTKILPYGSATGTASFTCVSTDVGITCTVPGGKGFTIARSGIQPVGS